MTTSAPGPSLHHAVICVHPDRLTTIADYWRDLGFEFVQIELEDLGLRVLLDWDRGIELITPVTREPASQRFWDFLERSGDGIYSLVVKTSDLEHGVAASKERGGVTTYRQHRESGPHAIDEAELTPMFGVPITLLQTDL